MINLRITGKPLEVEKFIEMMDYCFPILDESKAYRNSGSKNVRVYLSVSVKGLEKEREKDYQYIESEGRRRQDGHSR